MTTQICVNLPVNGSTDPRRLFVQSEVHRRNGGLHGDLQKFKEFTDKPIVNAKEATEVLVCLSQKSKAKVNEIVDAAVRAGAVESRPAMDHGFMFGRSF